ncbi:MAG: hypothetical protein K2Q09_06970 [Phycisphaerales bacterium]|nr:hypothetical protein [Phycisphaerales bacterium]
MKPAFAAATVTVALGCILLPGFALGSCWRQVIRSCCAVVSFGQAPQLKGGDVGTPCTRDTDCADFITASPNTYQVEAASSGGWTSHATVGLGYRCKFYIVRCVQGKCTKDTTTLYDSPCTDDQVSGSQCP